MAAVEPIAQNPAPTPHRRDGAARDEGEAWGFLVELAEVFEDRHAQRHWRAQAACLGADPALFFPERGESPDAALAICARCPVRRECLEAHQDQVSGIFGGTSGRTRRAQKHERVTQGRAAR